MISEYIQNYDDLDALAGDIKAMADDLEVDVRNFLLEACGLQTTCYEIEVGLQDAPDFDYTGEVYDMCHEWERDGLDLRVYCYREDDTTIYFNIVVPVEVIEAGPANWQPLEFFRYDLDNYEGDRIELEIRVIPCSVEDRT